MANTPGTSAPPLRRSARTPRPRPSSSLGAANGATGSDTGTAKAVKCGGKSRSADSTSVAGRSKRASAGPNISSETNLRKKPAAASSGPAPPVSSGKKRKATATDDKDHDPTEAAVPAAASLMTAPVKHYSTGDIDDATPPPGLEPAAAVETPEGKKSRRTARPVGMHMTNALLRTPHGSRVVAAMPTGPAPAPKREEQEPSATPSKRRKKQEKDIPLVHSSQAADGIPSASALLEGTTTDTLLTTAQAHIAAQDINGKLKAVIENHHCHIFSPEGLAEEVDPFRSLVSGIMAQQVSGAAAKSIKNKFIALFPLDDAIPFPTPQQVAAMPIPTLRQAGLSQRKAEYIQGLAEKFASGELTAQMLAEASDAEILERLTAVRGLGRWSVEMFACFALKRVDIFSTGDLGVQRGLAAYVGRDVGKLKNKGGAWKYMSEREMLEWAERFAPYRSLFMWYLWRIENVDVSAVQGD
ncbi:MAG: 3-methyladenine DNA glycosylase [Alyxoria varia]|nr:MAG: 3-methyladenine DNA glycosylase [Alyxoria varia]